MGRPPGRRNANFEAKREAIALALSRGLVGSGGAPSSWAELARAAGVSVPTLRHYFGSYDDTIAAAFAAAGRSGGPQRSFTENPPDVGLHASMDALADLFVKGWPHGLGKLFADSLTHGLGNATRGPAMVDHLLEPMLQSIEARLAVHAERGELRAGADLRTAGLAYFSPILMALLHQHDLSGAGCRPLDLDAFRRDHVAAWAAAWGPVRSS
jgi:AcrR family transcriptional regulator